MTEQDWRQPEGEPARTLGRRHFVRGVGAVGIVGAVGAAPFGETVEGQPVRQQVAGFRRPDGIRPGGTLDSRFPVAFETSVGEGFRVMTEYYTALNQRDVTRMAGVLHFPFAIYENIEPIVVDTADAFRAEPPSTLNGTGSGITRIKPGSYDLLESIDVHLYCPVGAVFSMSFTRYNPDGHKLLTCDGIYSVTNNDGRWAIQMASTMFHEVDYLGISYDDAEAAEVRGHQNRMAAFRYRDEDVLNDPQRTMGRYEPPLPVGTRTASVSFGYGPRDRTRDARAGRPMAGWRIDGVTSRLRLSEVTEEQLNTRRDTNLDEFVDLAGQAVGDYDYTRSHPVRPRVIHATHDKAHAWGGYLRYTADATLISETRSVGIRIYKAGHWGGAGSLGQVTHHDRSNSAV